MTSSLRSTVLLSHCRDYSPARQQDVLHRMYSALDLPESLHGRVVLLKPNLISSRGPALACTNPFFVRAVALVLHEKGAKIKIGDSPAFGSTASVMARHGMMDVLSGLPVEQVLLRTPVERTLAGGVTVGIAAETLECDLLMNLPKLKAHNQMYVTCAVKNFFGVVVGIRKAMLHMTRGGSHSDFADVLLALPDLMPPHCSLVDGIEVMHGSGPLDGQPLRLGCIGMARCPVALDTAFLDILELSKSQSPLWLAANGKGHVGSRSEAISYPLALPEEFHGSGFVAPAHLNPVRFHPFKLLVNAARRFRLAIRG